MSRKEYVIVLDLSLNETGYAVFRRKSRGNPGLVEWGTINNDHFETSQEGRKLQRIEMQLMILRASFFPADIVCEEWLANVKNSGRVNKNNGYTSAYKLGGVHGIAKKVFNDVSEFYFINNKTMKRVFAGNGNAEKQDIIDRCYEIKEKLVGKKNAPLFTVKNDNDADAIGLGVTYFTETGEWK
ncbi:RuvC family protein [Bacillus licheniformis]|uniref:hypothetical protein n=1 Tax=Bacillus licheniformis TaxID=1402 RepID=UPI000B3EA26C|nr:hypothetical protein [Bacillus licheniformis]ARW41725.1 hypothetical protein S100141_00402 [Bacillus licheniformis]MEC0474997.1 hypothetical protein [Bacillus licheniformis]